MITVVVYPNPLDPTKRTVREVEATATLRGLTRHECNADEWPVPTFAVVNGEAWLRERWEEPLPDGATVEFRSVLEGGKDAGYIVGAAMVVVGAVLTITGVGAAAGIGMIVGGVASLAMTALTPSIAKPDVPITVSGQQGSPTYSVGYRANQKRVGEPIPIVYGRHRLLPDLVTATYAWYQDADDQYIGIVLCLGVGEFDVDTSTLKFGEADFSQLVGVSYQVVPPGGNLTLFRDRVVTSQAVNGQTLVGAGTVVQHTVSTAVNVTFTAWDVPNKIQLISTDQAVLGTIAYGDMVTITGATNSSNNGIFLCVGAVNASQIFLQRGSGSWGVETSNAVLSEGGVALWANPVSLTFSASTKKITGPAGTFSAAAFGYTLTVANSVSNNGTYTVASVAGNGAWVQVDQSLVDETRTGAVVSSQLTGWSGWVEITGAADAATDIEVDLVAPRGLGVYVSGALFPVQVDAEIQVQGIDANGDPAGSVYTHTCSLVRGQAKAARQSYQWANPTAYDRVRIRYRRTTQENLAGDHLDTVVIGAAKAYLSDKVTYPGVTVLAVKAKASEQLTAQQAQQVSVVATRKLPIWNGSTWSAPTATRSPAWAMADVLRGSAALPDSQIDLPALLALDATWSSRGDYFDGVFDQELTVWEALEKIARAGRGQPVLSGGVVTVIRDQSRSVRTAMFTPANILPGTLNIAYRLPQEADPDGTEVAWIDPANAWQPAHVEYREGGGAIASPQTFDLFGVTNLAQATREATYLDRCRLYQRKVLSWETEMDGHLVSVGDLVGLSHDVLGHGQSAELIAVDGTTYTASEPFGWSGGSHSVLFRRPDGSAAGPYAVTAVSGHPEQFVCATALDFTPRTTLENGDRTTVILDPTAACDVVISSVRPGSGTTVEITAIPYDSRVHASGA